MQQQWEPILRQYDLELQSWQRYLQFFRQENEHLSARVAALLSNNRNHYATGWLERFEEEQLSVMLSLQHMEDDVKLQRKLRGLPPHDRSGASIQDLQTHQAQLQHRFAELHQQFLSQQAAFENWIQNYLVPYYTGA